MKGNWGDPMLLATLGDKRSLTVYPNNMAFRGLPMSTAISGGMAATTISNVAQSTGLVSARYTNELSRYVSFNQQMQHSLTASSETFMNHVRQQYSTPTTSQLRDRTTWAQVKRFVTREELMKLQIGGKADLPLTEHQISDLKIQIAGKDLTSLSDKDVESIIDSIVRPDDRQYLAALKEFKLHGKSSELLQTSKLDSLKKDLDSIDFDNITAEQYKHLKENYIERPEYHHRESISSDPAKQSDADNVDILKTSEHDRRHTYIDDAGNEKVSYKEPVKETPNNRNQELKEANDRRVFKNELKGLGMAVAIGAGIGFTIGFITSLAQNGITPDSIKNAVVSGLHGGLESGLLSGVGYGIGRTLGEVASKALTGVLQNAGLVVTENIAKMVSMGVVGTLTIAIFSIYQFTKLKLQGASTKDALVKTGKQMLIPLSLLAVSIAVQALLGGNSGLIVSIGGGVILTAYSAVDMIHQRKFSAYIREYTIEKYYPVFATIT